MLGIFRKQDTFLPYAEVKSLSEAYEIAVRNVINCHEEVVTEDGEVTWQSNPFTICITQPWRTNFIHKFSPYGKMFYKKYAEDIINGPDGEFIYDYHSRLFHYRKHYYDAVINEFVPSDIYGNILAEEVDQVQYIINKINEHPTTRRAIGITWSPVTDTIIKDVPCFQFVQFWKDKHNCLNGQYCVRSNDILLGTPQNMYGFYKLQSYIAKQTDSNCGKMWYQPILPHIYHERDNNELSKWL